MAQTRIRLIHYRIPVARRRREETERTVVAGLVFARGNTPQDPFPFRQRIVVTAGDMDGDGCKSIRTMKRQPLGELSRA